MMESDFLFFYKAQSAAALIPLTIGEDYPPLNNKLIAFYLSPVLIRTTPGEKNDFKNNLYRQKVISV